MARWPVLTNSPSRRRIGLRLGIHTGQGRREILWGKVQAGYTPATGPTDGRGRGYR
jgi:hypothetical protein